MKRIGRIAYWLAVNATIVATAWLGYVEEVDGARRVCLFLLGAGALIAFLVSTNKAAVASMRAKGPTVPIWLTTAIDLPLALSLVWYDAIGAATLLLVNLLLTAIAFHDPAKDAK